MANGRLAQVLERHRAQLSSDWIREQTADGVLRDTRIDEAELRGQCDEFLALLVRATLEGGTNVSGPAFAPVRDMLERMARWRGERGFTPSQTALFVLSLKKPIFSRIRVDFEREPGALFQEIWRATELIDSLALLTTEAFQRGREAVIARQQAEMLELSTPVVKLWEGILALPLIGTLDSARTQTVMETLLQRVVETGSEIVIIDITGVPTVDTLVAQHLLKTVSAARLMGVECIISGVRPQIAQTIVHLGVALSDVITKANLADAFKLALSKRGMGIGARTGGV
ncbi:MAG: STAS domain-containing protein [Pseudomonadota bacterium]|nr:MAG: anti-anti-sigma factor [Pseudomonadota bacterium]